MTTPPPASSACFALTGSRACSMFSDLRIQPYNNVFSNVNELDRYIQDSFPSSETFRSYFQRNFTCPQWNGSGLRYSQSFLCGLIVDISTNQFGCNPPTTPNICKSVATATLDSYQSLFNNPQFCTPGAQRRLPSGYTNFANRLTVDDPAQGCKPGTDDEQKLCGFASEQEFQAFCSTSSSEPCCTGAGKPGSTTNTTATGQASPNPSSSISPKKSGGSKTDTPVVIGAVVGALVLLFVIAGVIFYLIRRKKAGAAPDEASSAQTSEMMTVIYDYSPNLFDEIHLYVGDKVEVKCKFDDGWAYGMNMTTKKEGSFPLACVEPASGPLAGGSYEQNIRTRVSSLYVSNNNIKG